jgi:hypothetical protein
MSFGIRHLLKKNEFENLSNFKSVRFGIVTSVDSIPITSNDEGQKERDRRYNADPFIIRTRVLGGNFDKNKSINELPNCFPLIPKHVSVPPKVGELVLLFFFSEDLKNSDRLYIGPLVSSLQNIFKEEVEDATSSFAIGLKSPTEDLSKVEELRGVYPDNKDVSLQGRDNTDIQFGTGEIRFRAGKFKISESGGKTRKSYNDKNPAYIQIRYDAPLEKADEDGKQKKGSVANIVADKINILGVQSPIEAGRDNGDTISLTDREHLINDKSLIAILERAEPVMFGNRTIDYITKLENFVLTHVHRGNGVEGVTLDNNETKKILTSFDKSSLLSENVRIN